MKSHILFLIALLGFLAYSCPNPSSSDSPTAEDIVELPDMTTKIVNGQTIPDTILGFRIGMTSAEVHQVAAKRGMKKNTVTSTADKHTFHGNQFLGLATNRVILKQTAGAYDDMTISLKKVDRATFDQAVAELTKHLGNPTENNTLGSVTKAQWTYGSWHRLYIRLNLSLGLLLISYTKQ